MIRRLILLSICLTGVLNSQGQNLLVRPVVDSLIIPWEILWGPDNWIWFTERDGHIGKVNPETGELKRLYKIGYMYYFDEAGLLGMELHPSFPDTPWVYAVYNYVWFGGEIRERIVRYTYDGDTLKDETNLLDSIKGNVNHNGSRLKFGPDRKLYISTGERNIDSLSQSNTSVNGKILRMNADGSAPSDNPFGGYIWAKGLRNTQGLAWIGNNLYGSEHGPQTDDEVNHLLPGYNYGWPLVRGFADEQGEKEFTASHANCKEALYAWTPTIAPAGMDYYGTGAIKKWENCILMTSLKGNRIFVLKVVNEDSVALIEEVFTQQYGRLRDVCVSPDGRVFFATSNQERGLQKPGDDRIYEVKAEPNTIREFSYRKPDIEINPNPANSVLLLQNHEEKGTITVVNLVGQVFYRGMIDKSLRVSCADWPTGMYLVRYEGGAESGVLKVQVAH